MKHIIAGCGLALSVAVMVSTPGCRDAASASGSREVVTQQSSVNAQLGVDKSTTGEPVRVATDNLIGPEVAAPAGTEDPETRGATVESATEPEAAPDSNPDPTAEQTTTEQTIADNPAADRTADAAAIRRPPRKYSQKGIIDLSFDDVEFELADNKQFERSQLPEHIDELHEKELTIRGFILASSVFQQHGIKQFVLVRDNQQCCFGPGAKVYHNMQVEMEPGQTADFSIRPVAVTGTFRIKPWIGPDDICYSIYHLTASRVK